MCGPVAADFKGRSCAGRIAVIGLSAVLLSGCGSALEALPGVHAAPDPPELATKYCYRTLAEVDCYAERRPAEDARRVDWFDSRHYQ